MLIVRMALARPRMVTVGSLLILLLGILTIMRSPTDVFPSINVPVVNVIWSYGGLAPEEMAERITNSSERGIMTTVDNSGACRVAVPARRLLDSRLPAPRHEHGYRHRADHRDLADDHSRDAARVDTTDYPSVERLERPGAPARDDE